MTHEADNSDGKPDDAVTVLIVDDGVLDRRMAGVIVEKQLGWLIESASDGTEALEHMGRQLPHVVLTDMRMPNMDGLQLVAEVRNRFPDVPVVLMTGHGNEEVAMRALQEGAASYVPKKCLSSDLATTLRRVVDVATIERRRLEMWKSLTRTEFEFLLTNDWTVVPDVIAHIQSYLERLGRCDATDVLRIGVTLEESLVNAIHHGNLEVSSCLRQEGGDLYLQTARERREVHPYCDRRVHFVVRICEDGVHFTVRDEGNGFDPSLLPDPTDPAGLERIGGRGLLLIHAFMDEVEFNETGNQITMVKRWGDSKV